MKIWLKKLLAMGAIAVMAAACGGGDPAPPSLAQAAQARGFTALVAAATKANLVTALSDTTANLTVLGPTDAAFTALATNLGFASATDLVAALDGPTLAKILQYHVLPGRKTAADLTAGGASQPTLYNFAGSPATVGVKTSGGVKFTDAVLTDANVTVADVAASNVVLHAIDKVLVPPGVLNLVQMAKLNPNFSTLVGAVGTGGLAGTLSGTGPFTVFAPTNAAFAAIASTVSGLTTSQLATVLEYHVLASQVLSSGIPYGVPVATVAGAAKTITFTAGTPPKITDFTGGQSNIVAVDVRASNGVIHVIDRVLIPSLP